MGESPLNQAPFLPQHAPQDAVSDYSGVLTSMQVGRLDRQAYDLSKQGVKAKVVVLPKDFSTPDISAFGAALAQRWKVSGDRLLMIVDLKDRKVKMYPGHDLETHGLTGQLISTDIIPHHFVPYMKQHDLSSAIYSAMEASQNAVGKSLTHQAVPGQTQASQQYPNNRQAYPTPTSNNVGLWVGLGLFIAVIVALYAWAFKSRKQDNHKLADSFKERAGRLYERADQIGSASEYLSTEKYPELAQRIAQFFNKLTTLEKAVGEVDSLEKRNKVWQVRDGYLKLIRLASLLEPEADGLKTDVYAVTGGVQTVPELPANSGQIEAPVEEKQRERIPIPARFQDQMQYRRPEWTYQPAYYQPAPADGGLTGLMMLGMMLNQFEMNRRFDEINWHRNNQASGGLFGGDNQQADQQQNFDPGWGDTGGSAGFGDGGGDWGGGGGSDLGGGGGDFGGGGGDW
ncbi:MAG TPA: TPM domain-containing protein [Candidatus Obscuribacterales bacterium]